uniref:N-acetylgalactosaminide beta-1,3-galactosyltransferase n=1 Tax=Schistocephalus solidus TaxID=70667 RepID=A0A183SYM3_SCHSO
LAVGREAHVWCRRRVEAVDSESRKHLWLKTRFGVINAYRNHLNDFDFFMKADDDTYVIVENLRLLLSTKDPDVPMLLGCRFKVSHVLLATMTAMITTTTDTTLATFNSTFTSQLLKIILLLRVFMRYSCQCTKLIRQPLQPSNFLFKNAYEPL